LIYLLVQSHKPNKRVLVHGIDVRQLGYAKEEAGRVRRDRFVLIASRVNFLLRRRYHQLLLLDLLRQKLYAFEIRLENEEIL
jgi:hypothetical protein